MPAEVGKPEDKIAGFNTEKCGNTPDFFGTKRSLELDAANAATITICQYSVF